MQKNAEQIGPEASGKEQNRKVKSLGKRTTKMRMWMIDPTLLCTKHLVGEHGEIHKHRHNFVKQHKITGRVKPVVQISPHMMKTRHDELAEEMTRRGGNHQSPYELPNLSHLIDEERYANVDVKLSTLDLVFRCKACSANILK